MEVHMEAVDHHVFAPVLEPNQDTPHLETKVFCLTMSAKCEDRQEAHAAEMFPWRRALYVASQLRHLALDHCTGSRQLL